MEARGRRPLAAGDRPLCRALRVPEPVPPFFIKLEVGRARVLPIDLARKFRLYMLAQFLDGGWIESARICYRIRHIVVGRYGIAAQRAQLAAIEPGEKRVGDLVGRLREAAV